MYEYLVVFESYYNIENVYQWYLMIPKKKKNMQNKSFEYKHNAAYDVDKGFQISLYMFNIMSVFNMIWKCVPQFYAHV